MALAVVLVLAFIAIPNALDRDSAAEVEPDATVSPIAVLSTATATVPSTDAELIDRAQDYVVLIRHANGTGSGVLLGEDSLVLTNYHVIAEASTITAVTSDGTTTVLRLLTFDVARDLALLQAQTTLPEPPPIRWAKDEVMSLGEPLLVIGYPIFGDSITVTRGILSGRPTVRGEPMLQTDAALNPGVSGGAAISGEGEIVGIAVSGLESAENVGFLIPASQVAILLDAWLRQLAAGDLELPDLTEIAAVAPAAPALSPTSRPTSVWLDAWSAYILLHNEYVARHNSLLDNLVASGSDPRLFIDDYRSLNAWYKDEGPHFVVLSGRFPNFLEVGAINDRIEAYVEDEAESARLYVRHLETHSEVLWDQFEALRTHIDQESLAIWDAVDALEQGWRQF